MKKSILFLLALFSVTMTTQAVDYYYRGSQNSWGATKITGNTGANGLFYYYKASASTNHEFKVTDNNTSNWSGNNWGTGNYVNGYNGADVNKQTSSDNCKVDCNSEHYILLYVGNNGKNPVICASKTLPNGLNTVWIKHDWGGSGNWTYKQATKNADGTFSLADKYGATGCNLNAYNGENAQWWYDVKDISVEAGLAKGDEAVFTVDPVTRKISVTKKVNKNIGSITVTMACAQQPNIYYFGGVDGATTYPDWPGVKMNDNGNGTYSYKVDNVDLDLGLDYVITLKEVNENEWKSGDLNARADVNHDASILNITSIAMHGNFSGSWKDSEHYSVNNENYNSATLKMTIEKGNYEFGMRIGASDNWTSNGKTFTRTNSSYVVKAGSGNLKLTADMTGEYEFKWTYKTNTLEIVFPEEEVVVPHTYTVVGSSPELFTNTWSPAETANNMEKQADGSYKKVYNNIELTSDVEWKIAKDGTWWNETPLENKAANGNSVLTISKSGIYNVTFTLSADLKTAHAEAELLEETNTVADCFVSGNAALTGGAGWAGNEFKMEYDPATETYSYTLTGLAAETAYELQVVLGGNWYGYERLQTIPNGVENKEGHIAFTLAEAGNVTVTYHVTNGINLTGNFALPVTYDYYIAGTLAGGWSATQQGMTKDGDVYKHTFSELNAGEYEFKITDGQFNSESDNTHEHTTLGAAYEEVSYNEGNIKIVTEEAINLTVIFNAATDKITFVGLTVSTAPTKYYVKGTHNEWTADATSEMTLDGEVYKKEVTLAKDVEFKINDGADGWWGANNLGGKVYKELEATDNLKMKEAKTFTIIFNPSENLITFIGLTEETPVVEDLSKQPSVLYFHPSDQWKADDARFAAYFYGTEEKWISMTDADKDGIYEVVNDKKNKNVIFCRMNPANNENKWGENGSHKWNQSADLEIPTTTYLNYWMVAANNTTWDNPEGKWMMLIGSGDNSEALAAADDQTVEEVYVNRSFTAGQLYTIALPFDLNADPTKTHFGAGVKVIKFTQLEKDEKGDLVLWFNDALGMAAGKPYLITPSVSVDGFVVNNVVIKNAEDNIALTTTGASVTMEAVLSASKNATNNGKYWLASNNYLYNTSTALKSLRAVFDVQTSKVNVRARVAFGENVETGVEDIFTTDAPVKVIENGQLIIIRDGVKYNVQGQKL